MPLIFGRRKTLIFAQKSGRELFPSADGSTLIYGTNARIGRDQLKLSEPVVDAPDRPITGSLLVRLRVEDGQAQAVSYPIRTIENDPIENLKKLDENRVIFQIGESFDRVARFHLFLFDFRTEKMGRLTTRRLINRNWKVSPNQRYIAFLDGVDQVGDPLGIKQNVAQLRVLDMYQAANA